MGIDGYLKKKKLDNVLNVSRLYLISQKGDNMGYNTGGSSVEPVSPFLKVDTLAMLLKTEILEEQRPTESLEICTYLNRN